MSIAASLVVSFGEGGNSDAFVAMEFDDQLNVDADGKVKSQFGPGDDVFFRIQHDSSVRLSSVKATHGMIAAQGSGNRNIEQVLLWEQIQDSHELSHFPYSGLTPFYYGNQAAGMRREGQREVVISGGELPALSLVRYTAVFQLFRLLAPKVVLGPDETYPVAIVAYMEAV